MENFARSWKLGENGEVFSGFLVLVFRKIRWRPNWPEKEFSSPLCWVMEEPTCERGC